jgi:hypothetical protein
MEKLDLDSCEGRILKLTGRAIVVRVDAVFCVEKIDTQSYE